MNTAKHFFGTTGYPRIGLLALFALIKPLEPALAQSPASLCVGHTLALCLTAIRAKYKIDDAELNEALAQHNKRDINGNLIYHSIPINFDAHGRMISLQVGSDDIVKEASIEVNHIYVEIALNEYDYDKTEILPAMSALGHIPINGIRKRLEI